MEKWSKPRLTDLSVRYTEAGGAGGAPDGQAFQIIGIPGFIVFGGSGAQLPNPPFVPYP